MINILAEAKTCNLGGNVTIPGQIVTIIQIIIGAIKIGVPLLLIIFGMLDMGKAVMAQKDDEIKKAQQTFVKRLLAAAITFFVIVIVQLLLSIVDDGNNKSWNCVSCLIGNADSCTGKAVK